MQNDDFLAARRFAIATFMVEVLRGGPWRATRTPNERVLIYCVMISTYGPRPVGLSKIASMAGLPRNTVKRALARLEQSGLISRRGRDFVLSADYVTGERGRARAAHTLRQARTLLRRLREIDKKEAESSLGQNGP